MHAHRGIALAAEHQLVEGEMPDLAFGHSVSRDARRGHLRAVLAAPLVFPMGCCPLKASASASPWPLAAIVGGRHAVTLPIERMDDGPICRLGPRSQKESETRPRPSS